MLQRSAEPDCEAFYVDGKPTWIRVTEIIAIIVIVALVITVSIFFPCALCFTVPLGLVLFWRWARRGPKQPQPPGNPAAGT